MNVNEFKECLPKVEFVILGGVMFFTSTKELFNPVTNESIYLDDIEDLYNQEINGIPVLKIIENMDSMLIDISGGRGSSSSSNSNDERTFSFASDNSDSGKERTDKPKFPAYFNDGRKFQSESKALEKFRDKHANSEIEYAIAVDKQGYVHRYIQGMKTSVAIAERDGKLIIHNHPSGGNFSKADLLTTTQNRGQRGIVASGKHGDYIFKKRSNFKSAQFAKAINTAQMKGKDYNDATDKWLKKNQKRFGYEYEFKKVK